MLDTNSFHGQRDIGGVNTKEVIVNAYHHFSIIIGALKGFTVDRPPAICSACNFGGQSYGLSRPSSWFEVRGKKSVSSLFNDLRVWKRTLIEIEADMRERFRNLRFLHLARAAKEFIENDAWGATNCSRPPFSLPRSRAVKLLLPSWTSSPMSRTLTISANWLFRM